MTKDFTYSWRGFIALFSVLTLSGILFLLTAFADYAAFLAHEAVSDEYSYRSAQEAAFSCSTFALSRLYADPLRFSGVGTTTIQLTELSLCEILSASVADTNAETVVQGLSGKSTVRMRITGKGASSTGPLQQVTWEEY
jgi:hypothetical protein